MERKRCDVALILWAASRRFSKASSNMTFSFSGMAGRIALRGRGRYAAVHHDRGPGGERRCG
ncbi:MAG: hypothetical protein M3P49_10370 [Actinomycetota bacterium]|nr:hypothetical protein [Actinomycetota bacterium]